MWFRRGKIDLIVETSCVHSYTDYSVKRCVQGCLNVNENSRKSRLNTDKWRFKRSVRREIHPTFANCFLWMCLETGTKRIKKLFLNFKTPRQWFADYVFSQKNNCSNISLSWNFARWIDKTHLELGDLGVFFESMFTK